MPIEERPLILVVDDEPINLCILLEILSTEYNVFPARSGKDALLWIEQGNKPDLILLDVVMPETDGFTICSHLKSQSYTRDIPVIFISARDEEADESAGFQVGAVDYINKPVSSVVTKARVSTHLKLAQAQKALQQQNSKLEVAVWQRTRELQLTQDITTLAMASLAETRDNETGNHIRRTQNYVRILAEKLRNTEGYSHVLNSDHIIDLLYKSAPLHDIGKVGIPDQILLKPDKLTDSEFEHMKQHATLGGIAIENAERELSTEIREVMGGESFLRFAREIAHSHHEKWDGSGYPDGISGDQIPVSARLMAVADVYDALISKRVYKPAFSHEKAMSIIQEGRGSHFDPNVVDAFVELEAEVLKIAGTYTD